MPDVALCAHRSLLSQAGGAEEIRLGVGRQVAHGDLLRPAAPTGFGAGLICFCMGIVVVPPVDRFAQ